MRNKTKSKILITAGGLLLAAALSITAYNLYADYRAGAEARSVLDALMQQTP